MSPPPAAAAPAAAGLARGGSFVVKPKPENYVEKMVHAFVNGACRQIVADGAELASGLIIVCLEQKAAAEERAKSPIPWFSWKRPAYLEEKIVDKAQTGMTAKMKATMARIEKGASFKV